MKWEWDDQQQRMPVRRQLRRFRTEIQSIPLRHRLDVMLAAGLAVVLAILAATVWLGVEYAQQAGWFDPNLVEQITDERILVNVRDRIDEQPLLDAVWHKPDGTVVIAQTGGAFHTYNPATGLWTTERPFTSRDAIDSDFTLLRSGCGAHPLADNNQRCADPDSLWAVSIEGGLARKLSGHWSIVVADSKFLGADGKPVTQEELTAAALSDNGDWLLVGTRNNGIGVYNLRSHRWQTVPTSVQSALPTLAVTHAAWAGDAFWIGSAQGVAKLTIAGDAPTVEPSLFPQLEVLDMDAADGALWVLGRRTCPQQGEGCLWLGYVERSGNPSGMMVENAIYPDLNADKLFFAQMWGDDLVVAGPAGIYRYTPSLHNWEQLFKFAVANILPAPGGQGFYFGYRGGAGLAAPGAGLPITLWPLENESVAHLTLVQNQTPLALTASGKAVALRSDGSVATVYAPQVTSLDPQRFHAAIAAGDVLAFVSREGVLIHDVTARTYRDLAADVLPAWLTTPDTRFVVSNDMLYVLTQAGRSRVEIYRLALGQIVDANFLTTQAANLAAETVPGPISQSWAWGAGSLGLLDGEGSIERLEPGASAQLVTGPRTRNLDLNDFRDVIEFNNDMVVATREGLQRYDMQQRAWSAVSMPTNYGASAELAVFDHALYVRTDTGRLLRPATNPASVIGGEGGFTIPEAELSDALLEGDTLYYAGAGRVERYSLSQRRIDQTWMLSGAEPVTLVAIADGQPLALNSRRAYWGEQALDTTAGNVLGLSLDDSSIWTVRETGGVRYLKGYPLDRPDPNVATCFFRQPSAGETVTTVRDALHLPNGWIAVATNRGLRFYSPEQRSWRTVRSDVFAPDRLYLTSRYLILVQENAQENTQENAAGGALAFVPLNSLSFPSSCAATSVELQHTDVQARAVAVDAGRNRAAWLATDGSLHQWEDGSEHLVLAADGQGPEPDTLRRLFQHGDYLLVATNASLWRYDLRLHDWQNIQLGVAADSITDINVEATSNGDMVTVTTDDNFATGLLPTSADSVLLQPATVGERDHPFGADSAQILDIQNRSDGLWTFVLPDRIKYFDPVRRAWRPDAPLGAADPSLELRQAAGRSVAVGDGGRTWWIAQQPGAAAQTFVRFALRSGQQHALDAQGDIWILDNEGQLQTCTPDGGQYNCRRAAPLPFYINPADVVQVYGWGNLLLFVTTSGLRAFDVQTLDAATLPVAANDFRDVSQTQLFDDQIWLLGRQGLLILRQSRNAVTGQLVPGVSAGVVDVYNGRWARFADSWRRQEGEEFVAPTLDDGRTLAEAGIRFLVAEGVRPIGYDGAGYVYPFNATSFTRSDLPLPPQLAGRPLNMLSPGASGELWAIADGEWHHIVRSFCAPPVPALPPTPTPTLTPTPISALGDSLLPTPTPVLTPTLLPTPTPTPEPIPCLIDANHQLLPVGFTLNGNDEPVGVRYASGLELEVVNRAGQTLRITARPTYNVTIGVAGALPRTPRDQWPELQANLRTLGSGRTAYAPITQLVMQNAGLVANRPGYPRQVAANAALTFALPPALDAGWLRWNRDQATATVSTPDGPRQLAAQDLAQQGQLLFEGITGVLAAAPEQYYATTRNGVWFYSTPNLRLDDSNIQVALTTISSPVQAVHTRFYAANGVFRLDGQLDSSAPTVWTMRLGSVELDETIRARSVAGSLPIGARSVSPFAERGFLWDANRRSLAYAGDKLLLLTAAGVHATDFQNFDPGPPAVQRGEGRLLADANRQLYLAAGEPVVYYSYADSWQPQGRDPNADRLLISDSAWTWRISQGALEVALNNDAYQFRQEFSDGFGFTSDQLQFATAFAGDLLIMSNAFLERAAQPQQLGSLAAPRSPTLITERLDVVRYPQAQPQLYRTAGGLVTRWDDSQQRFVVVAPADNPFTRLLLVDRGRLRFTRLNQHIQMELRVDEVTGGTRWVTFTWEASRFPFDVVTGITAYDGQFYVGSMAGLQVYASSADFNIQNAAVLLDMSANNAAPLAAVDRLGSPMQRPDLVQVWADVRCVQRQDQGPFTACVDASLLNRRLRIQNSFWEWTADSAGVLSGSYLSVNLTKLPVTFEDGRLRHDHVAEVAACAGQSAMRWGPNWISIYTGEKLALTGSVRNFDQTQAGAVALLCVAQSLRTPEAQVEAGLYLLGRGGQYWRYGGNGWMVVNDRAANAAIADYAAHPPIYQRERLRLVKPSTGAKFTLEQRRTDFSWRPLLWRSNPVLGGYQITIDQWDDLLWTTDRLWVATPAGLVTLQANGGSPVRLLPEQLHLIPLPENSRATCVVSDMEMMDERMVLRCAEDSAGVFSGAPTLQQDTDVFVPHTGPDPFAERAWVDEEQASWALWRMKGRQGGAAGRLEGRLCLIDGGAETSPSCRDAINLGSGRFQFDTFNSLAIAADDEMLLATDAGGWFAYPQRNLNLRQAVRPAYAAVDALAVNHVGYMLGPEEDVRLCVTQKGGGLTTLAADGSAEQPTNCPEYAGRDNLWRYSVSGGALAIDAGLASEGGGGWRQLVNGRFTDDLVIGPPVTAERAPLSYLLPTAAGVLELNGRLDVALIHVGIFPGLAEDEAPAALYFWNEQTPAYVAADGIHALEGKREPLYTGAIAGPQSGQPRAAGAGPQDTLMLSWPRANTDWLEWSLLNTADAQLANDQYLVNVGDVSTYRSRHAQWGNPPAWMAVRLAAHTLESQVADARRLAYRVDIDPAFTLLAAIPTSDRLLLIGRTDLLELDVNQLVARTFESPAERPRPPLQSAVPRQPLGSESTPTAQAVMPTTTALPIVTPVTTAEPAGAKVLTAGLNVRKGPGINYGVLTTAVQDTPLQVISRWHANNWLFVETPSGVQGWVSGSYVELSGCSECIPVITVNPVELN